VQMSHKISYVKLCVVWPESRLFSLNLQICVMLNHNEPVLLGSSSGRDSVTTIIISIGQGYEAGKGVEHPVDNCSSSYRSNARGTRLEYQTSRPANAQTDSVLSSETKLKVNAIQSVGRIVNGISTAR
jgi:hypothetical protein